MARRERRLEGRAVLLTRSRERAAALVSTLEDLGARVEARAAIAFEGPGDPGPADAAVARADLYRWIVFTSPIGVRFFVERSTGHGSEPCTGTAQVVAIGPATARALSSAGLRTDLTLEQSHSQGLARELRSRVGPRERVLLVRPEAAAEIVPEVLRDSGVEVDAVAFYRTVVSADAGAVARGVGAGAYDVVVVTSPSNLRFMLEAADHERLDLVRALADVGRVAMGPTTAQALSEIGLPAHATATSPDDDGIVEAILV